VIAGLSVNKLRILDLAVERDPQITIRGDVQLVTGVLDRNDLQRMQQVREFIWNFIWIPLNFQLSKYFSHRKPSLFKILSLIKNQKKKNKENLTKIIVLIRFMSCGTPFPKMIWNDLIAPPKFENQFE